MVDGIGQRGGKPPMVVGPLESGGPGSASLDEFLFRRGTPKSVIDTRDLCARLRSLIEGCGPPYRTKLAKPLQLTYTICTNLRDLTRPDAPLACREIEAHVEDLLMSNERSGSIDPRERLRKILRALSGNEALAAWRAFASRLEMCFFDQLLRESARWSREAAVMFRDSGAWAAEGYLRTRFDELSEQYLQPHLSLRELASAHRVLMESLTVGLKATPPPTAESWRGLWREMDGILHDAGNVIGSIENELFYLMGYKEPSNLREALEASRRHRPLTVKGCIDFMRKVNLSRAKARGVDVSVCELPSILLPGAARPDFFRILNELTLNAIKRANLAKKGRQAIIASATVGSTLAVAIADNGPGIADIARALRDDEGAGAMRRRGLPIAMDLATRRGWQLSLASKAGEGTTAILTMDTTGWCAAPPSQGEGGEGDLSGPIDGGAASGGIVGQTAMAGALACLAPRALVGR